MLLSDCNVAETGGIDLRAVLDKMGRHAWHHEIRPQKNRDYVPCFFCIMKIPFGTNGKGAKAPFFFV